MGQVKVLKMLRFPNDDGFLGKTLRDGDSNVFGIKRNSYSTTCPVKGIEEYINNNRHLARKYLTIIS